MEWEGRNIKLFYRIFRYVPKSGLQEWDKPLWNLRKLKEV